MKHQVTAAIFLDTRRAKNDGTFPVKLRVTYQRTRQYYPMGQNLSQADFDKVMGERPRGEYKEHRADFEGTKARAIAIIDSMTFFSFPEFETLYSGSKPVTSCAFGLMESYVQKLKAEGRAKTAHSYHCALKSIKAYNGRETLPYSEITLGFLEGYERWMLQEKKVFNGGKPSMRANSKTTVGIYLRSLRTIYNLAISDRLVSPESYPFGKRGYKVPAGRNIKKALPLADIKKLFEYKPTTEAESYNRDLWLFSYLCNGANMIDIARLQYGNIDGEDIVFIRSKTERTTKHDLKPIVSDYRPEARDIVDRWGQKPAMPNTYIFPVLKPGDTPQRELEVVQQMTKQVNKYIDRIAKSVGIEQHVTTYTARHSFATVLKLSDASISYISEALGHKDLKTTENYLGSFDSGTRKRFAANLTAFEE